MRPNKMKLFMVMVVAAIAAGLWLGRNHGTQTKEGAVREITPTRGPIRIFVSSTGTVLPKNRLEIQPPVNGRIESILVQEGDKVKTGQVLAWMSSTDRAALLDAARGKGEAALAYWQQAYKPIPLLAPIDGEVIVATTQPGQTVTTGEAVLVLSDRLIVRAQVDETDIGKISVDKKAVVSLDAYPDTKIDASIEHIYYESKTVNNVTIYEVDLAPREIPLFFRSGMNATVDFIEESREDALLLPVEAVHRGKEESYVLVKEGAAAEPARIPVKTGITDEKNIEILSGVREGDRVVLTAKEYSLPEKSGAGKNPFLPQRPRR